MSATHTTSQFDLKAAALECMTEHGFQPAFSAEVRQQVAAIQGAPAPQPDGDTKDLRNLLWSAIDNDTSRDIDQIEVAEKLPNGDTLVRIGIADVDALVQLGTPVDKHAARETTTVYTGVQIFPMLPEELSTGTTSLNEGQDRLAVVIEYSVTSDGHVGGFQLYKALVNNKAQLAYNSVGAWLEGKADAPPKVVSSKELQAQLKLQDEAAQCLRAQRYRHGALDIETIETHPILLRDEIVDIASQEKNRATQLIEDFMIAANNVVARTLSAANLPSIRRIVKTPKRWDRIVELAKETGDVLPAEPDSKALNEFLTKRKAADPEHFPDLSLAVVKLMGPGEYVLEMPSQDAVGHFGLAVQDYTHSTAPNRRFADVATQRLVKAMIAKKPSPYSADELNQIATNCTLKEDGARKVEREMQKRIAAVAMSGRIGESFDAVVTGVNKYGTFVRVLQPHLEGKLVSGEQGLDVGDRARVTLVRTDPRQGFIDFSRARR